MSELHQVERLEQLGRRSRELAALNAISSAVSESSSLDELMTFILDQAVEATACDAGLVSLVDPGTGKLTLSAHQGLPETLRQRFERYGLEGTLCHLVFEDGGDLGIGDLADGAPVDVSELLAEGLHSYLGAPLVARDKVLGSICVFDRHPRRVTEADLSLMRAIGGELAVAIENARFFDQLADLTVIQKTISELTATLSFDEAIRALLPQVASVVGADAVSIFLIRDERMTRIGTYPTGKESSQIAQTLALADYPLTRQVIETRQPLTLTADDPRFQAHAGEAFNVADVTAGVTVPLVGREGVLGILTLGLCQPGRFFTEGDVRVLQMIAGQATIALEKDRLFEQIERHTVQLRAAAQVSRAASSVLDVEQLVEKAVNLIRDHFDFYYVGLFLLDEDGKFAVLRAGTGEAGRIMLGFDHKLEIGGESMIGWCVAHRQARIALDVGQEASRFDNPVLPDTRSEMALPLISRGEILGGITVQSTEAAAFSDQDVAVLQTMADQIANAIANAQQFELAERARAETGKRVRELDCLNKIGQKLAESPPVEELLPWVAERIPSAMQYPSHCVVAIEYQGEIYGLPEAKALSCQVAQSLSVGGQVAGRLYVAYTEDHEFLDEESALLGDIARRVGSAVGFAQLYTETQRRSERLAKALAVSEWLHRGLELEQVLDQIAKGAVELGFRRAVINIYQPEEELVRVQAVVGMPDPEREALMGATYRWSDFRALMQEQFQVSRSYLIRHGGIDWETDFQGPVVTPSIEYRGPGYWHPEDMLLVPLWGTEGQPVGVLSVDEPVDNLIPDLNAIQTLETFAGQAAIAIENARLFDAAQQATLLMGEHVRELDCLNDIGRKMDETPPIPDFLQWVADRLSAAMRHSEVCVAAVEFESHAYGAAEAMNLPCQIVQRLRVGGDAVGRIYVAYTEEHDFLDEESALLGDVARRVGGYIENRRLFQGTQAALGETEEQARRLALLNEMGEQLNRAADRGEILDIGALKISQIFSADRASVALLTDADDKDSFEVFALHGKEGATPVGTRVQAKGSEMEAAVREKRLILVTDDQRDDLAGIRSFMVAPLLAGREAIGTLNVASKHPDAYTQRDGDLLLQAASLLSSAIDNRRLFEETRRRAEELVVLNELAQALTARPNVEQVLDETYRCTSRLMDTTNFYIALYDPDKQEFSFPLNISESEVDREISVIPAEQGISGYIIRSRTSVLIEEDVLGWQEERGVKSVGEAAASWLGVPLMIGDQVLGVMAVQSYTTPRAYDAHDRDMLTAIASQAAIAIQNARLFEQTQAALERVRTVHQQYIGEAWQGYLAARGLDIQPAYVYDGAETKPISDPHLSEIDQALSRRELTVDSENVMDEAGGKTITVPISLRGQPIGALAIEPPVDGRPWSEEDIALVEAVSEQLALAIENARLFEQTQYRAHREHLIREITDKIRSQTDLDAILKTTVMELGKALRTSGAAIRLGTEAELASLSETLQPDEG